MLDLSKKGLQIDGCLNLGQSGLQFVQAKSSGFPSTDVPSSEADALIRFYNATDGDDWTTNTGWGTDPVVNNWYGVTVSGGHVTAINLFANGSTLDGPGASYLRSLTSLITLQLYNTGLTGDISGYIALTNLKILYLGNTEVTGDISGFSSLTNLTFLRLYNTGVTGDISGFSSLINLTDLHLSDTGLTGDISGFSSLTRLTHLQLYNTGLTGDISGYSALIHLTYIRLYNTGVTGDISEYSALINLTYLRLYYTEVTGDISGYSALINLTDLHLYNTGVTYTETMSNWNNGSNLIYNLSWNVTTVNAFLVDLDATDVENGTLNISGTNAAPGASGLAALTSLESKGWDITVTT